MACSSMTMVNASVFCHLTWRTIFPWTILQVKEDSHTFQQFFDDTIRPNLESRVNALISAHIGPEKSSLDPVETHAARMIPVITSFGRFVKYFVESEDVSTLSESQTHEDLISDNLTFLPPIIITVKNKKDQLYNDIIELFVSCNALFFDSELQDFGKKLVGTLCDILWHIDGHHHLFDERALPIPPLFRSFLKYNVPELSKHRKRRSHNISSLQLRTFVQELTEIMDSSFVVTVAMTR